jgi:hypothetical protein
MSWIALAATVAIMAHCALSRLHCGKLFLFALPRDRAAWDAEMIDAARTAQIWQIPALAFLAVGSISVCLRASRGPMATFASVSRQAAALRRRHTVWVALFTVACVLDFASTAICCHRYGAIDEIHPGVRLVIYAFGLTSGVLAGKTIQALFVLVIAAMVPRVARPLLATASVLYLLAAAWNFRFL